MRVLVQRTQDAPTDWETLDSRDWGIQASKEIHALCVQGVVFEGSDHYSVKHNLDGSVAVAGWYDCPTDWLPGQRWGHVYVFHPLVPDPKLNGAINTKQQQFIYAESVILPVFEKFYAGNSLVTIKPWKDFQVFDNPFHGVWVDDKLHELHRAIRSRSGWREWTEGIDKSELFNGVLKDQRSQGRFTRPDGTQTYYHNATDLATSLHSADHENELGLTAAGASIETSISIKSGTECFAATTTANQPGLAAWPTSGTYRYQIDVSAVGASLIFGLLTTGNKSGHFGRVSGDLLTHYQSIVQDQAAFSGTGLHLASIVDPAWTSGANSDRFEVLITAALTSGHSGQDLSLQLGESDDYADGPWEEEEAARRIFIT